MKPQLTTISKFTESLAFMNLPVFEYIDSEDFAIIKIEELGMELPFQTPTFRPDYYNITIILNGTATYFVGDEIFELHPNHIIFTRPDVFICSRWEMIGSVFNISFSKRFLSQYCPAAIDEIREVDMANGYCDYVTKETMAHFEQICQEMYNEAIINTPYKHELLANLILNLVLLIQQYQNRTEPVTQNEKYNAIVTAFKGNMEENFSNLISGKNAVLLRTKDYADMQNLNENYLSKIISNSSGKTINQWINEKLIDEIKYLLKNSDKTMKEIAALFGFCDLNYFYNYFKKHTQNAPGAFRKDFNDFGNYKTVSTNKTALTIH